MADDHFIGIDHAEAPGLDVLFLAEGEQYVEELLIRFQHFYKFHNTAVGDIEFTVKAIGPRITFNADFADGREIYASDQFTDILRFRVGRRESSNSHAIFFTKSQ